MQERIGGGAAAQSDGAAKLVLVDRPDHRQREKASIVIRAVGAVMDALVKRPAGAVVTIPKEVSHTSGAHEAVAAAPPVSNTQDIHGEINNAVMNEKKLAR